MIRKLRWMDGVLALGVLLIIIGIGINFREKFGGQSKVEIIKGHVPTITVIQEKSIVVVDVAGEVLKPGVYELKKGERVADALTMAGGLAAEADREWVDLNINRAEILKDGMKIFIPKKNSEQLKQSQQILGVQKNSGVININTASKEELDKLTGIGPAMAERIIEYREKNGGFRDVNEIKLVSGIGEKLYEKIKEKIGI